MSRRASSESATLLDTDPGVKDVALVPAAPESESSGIALAIERLAANPDVDVQKLEKVIELQERIMRHNAKSAFDGAFARMQAELPEVDEKGQIVVKGTLRSRYARLEDIHKAIKPVLGKHGFAIRHRTEWPAEKAGIIRIVGILSHEQGHSEESVFEAPADKSDFRTDIQSQGSTVSYGRRYTTLDLLNITTRGVDDDGQKSGRPQAPEGYDRWLEMLDSVASDGLKAYEEAWNGKASTPDFKTFLANHDRERWTQIKTKANSAGKGRR